MSAPDIEAVLAAHRCVDVHPERHDQGGVGTCAACRSWGDHVADALRVHLLSEAVVERAARGLFEHFHAERTHYKWPAPEQHMPWWLGAARAALTAATEGDA